MTILPTVALVILPASALAARGGAPEPTQAEIQALAEQDVARAKVSIVEYHRRLGRSAVPDDMLGRLNALRKKACKPAGPDDAWRCEVKMDMTVPNGGFRSSTVMLRLVRSAHALPTLNTGDFSGLPGLRLAPNPVRSKAG